VEALRDEFGVSERRACKVAGQHRSTQRLELPPRTDEEDQLREWLRAFAVERPRWGWRRAAKQLRREGHQINNKRVRRLWREEGLQVPQKPRKKRLTGIGADVGQMSLIAPNALWAMDFQFDRTIDGRQVKLLNIIDEYTREAIAIRVDRSITADDVVDVLEGLTAVRGAPAFVRFDNGPEFVATVVAEWCTMHGTGAVFIDPGSPWQNAWVESFNGRMRDELLNMWQFDSLLEARVIIGDWRVDYNTNRPSPGVQPAWCHVASSPRIALATMLLTGCRARDSRPKPQPDWSLAPLRSVSAQQVPGTPQVWCTSCTVNRPRSGLRPQFWRARHAATPRETTPLRPRRPDLDRVRRRLELQAPTPTRIATGPVNGTPSNPPRSPPAPDLETRARGRAADVEVHPRLWSPPHHAFVHQDRRVHSCSFHYRWRLSCRDSSSGGGAG
jgi:putative transposase